MKYLAALILLAATLSAPADKIVCTTYPVWLLTRATAGGIHGFSIELMTPPHGGCAHAYTPLPGDLLKVKTPDTVLIANGQGLDEHLIAAALRVNAQLKVIRLDVPARDPHTFASPDSAKLMVSKLTGELIKLYPANRLQLEKNLRNVTWELDKLIMRAHALARSPQPVMLQHKIFINLASLCQAPTLLLKHEQADNLSPRELMTLIRQARKHNTKIIWAENHQHDPAVSLFARETKSRIVELDMLTGGSLDVPQDHYIQVMNRNFDKLQGVQR